MINSYSSRVLNNFENASNSYNSHAKLQRAVAWRLAKTCKTKAIPRGFWVDLGTGTGMLADALEACTPKQSVLRVDGSQRMLNCHKSTSYSQLCDLNHGLPSWPKVPNLLASSFALHWLRNPQNRVKEWFTALESKSWLALALPVEGSFSQWHHAAQEANVTCTAFPLPKHMDLLAPIPLECISHQKIYSFTQYAHNVSSLLRPMKLIGAQETIHPPLKIGEWRRLKKVWPRCTTNGDAMLTWLIQVLIVER